MQQFPLSSVISREFLQKELAFCREKITALLPRFQDCFPAANTEGLIYPAEQENFEWTTSFFAGMLWNVVIPDMILAQQDHNDLVNTLSA